MTVWNRQVEAAGILTANPADRGASWRAVTHKSGNTVTSTCAQVTVNVPPPRDLREIKSGN